MTEVPFGVPCKTRLWFSKRAWKEAGRHRDGRIQSKLKHCCQNGLWLFEDIQPPIVKHEWDGIYRIGFVFSLFRLVGFYEDRLLKRDFICIDAFQKSGKKSSAPERERINRAAAIKRTGSWRKDEFPKLA